ncbi:MAG: Single-stranded-DNA-specific exonuclease RecJ [Candidatus Saccharicenans subterraneus]|uniref:Single-stranded-DNA-specific exonuclease RecJ n=1 Tax=Candidatus Saccharicenans subterraneus TaxID=2508984 RepID=A0A3E2BNC3_9BACT|nr:MAG: Single-stranded-DNA-specific exonuclease RecJ [Candidatus Saccharicenans subterraneum]
MEARYRWQIAPPDPEAWILAQELNLPHEIATILVNRGLRSASEAAFFLYGGLNELHDPFLMKGMKEAVDRIRRAIEKKEKIVIFGDYDVDGILSVVMLVKALNLLGGRVEYFIPERMKDGYGLKLHHLENILQMKTDLLISVDCGIKAVDFVREARRHGLDVIITDHHHPGEVLPEALAILNPVLESSGYPDRNLAGVGVVFKLIQAIFLRLGINQDLNHFLKLVSIGTVADVAELKGENRILVREGLKKLKEARTPGLRSLLDGSGLNNRKLNEVDLGFRLGPRINAAGRLGMTEIALQLFFSESPEECNSLVKKLNELNSARQRIEEKILKEAVEKIEARQLHQKYRLLVLGSENWHRGVIGIVASRVKEIFYRPVILFAYENGQAYGSGRSVPELSLIDLVNECADLCQNFGGHKQAVGCTLSHDRLPDFKDRINSLARARITDELLERKLQIDCRLNFSSISPSFLDFYSRLLPFGVGNPRPVFVAEEADVLSEPSVVQNRHLKFWARQSGRVFEVMAWEKARFWPHLRRGSSLDLAYSLQFSDYRGKRQITLALEDLRAHRA